MPHKKSTAHHVPAAPEKAQLEALKAQLTQAQESERRALADYQNLVRRQNEDRVKVIKFATLELVSALLEPLNHLRLAAEQLNDQGLNMVVAQLWQPLTAAGLTEIEALGQPFDPHTMEVVERQGEGNRVIQVMRPGYRLNGEVVQVARVVVGDNASRAQQS